MDLAVSVPLLCEATLGAARAGTGRPGYCRDECRVGWVHFGPGAFHRAHQAYYADRLLADDPRFGICSVSLKSRDVRDRLAPQNFLYTLAQVEAACLRVRVIGSLKEILVAPDDTASVLARLAASDTRMVSLTITEKGYCLDDTGLLDVTHPDIIHDLDYPLVPRSAMGFLVEGLRRRRMAGEPPFTVVSCDNLPENGPTLRAAVAALAARRDAELAAWIEREVAFPRTMVDSITPATDPELVSRVTETTGLSDLWPVQREAFTQWVIEDVPQMHIAEWSSVGVTLTSDLAVYERAKLRLVNGAHSTLAYLGLLRGRKTVAEAMADSRLARFVGELMHQEIAPALEAAGDLDIAAYIEATLQRFRNPGMRHRLEQIAYDGSKKLPVRLIPSLQDALAAGRPFQRLSCALAGWMCFIVECARAGVPINDPEAPRLREVGRACTGDVRHDVGLFLLLEDIFPPAVLDLSEPRRSLEVAYENVRAGRL